MDKLTIITDERLGQYRTKKRALYHARMHKYTTGRNAVVVLTRTWRNLEPRKCYTVVFG